MTRVSGILRESCETMRRAKEYEPHFDKHSEAPTDQPFITQAMGNADLDFLIKFYEDSRHTVHSIEATQEATKVVECISQQCQILASRQNLHRDLLSFRADMLKFHHTMMQGFLARAMSNDRRMDAEQNLVTPNSSSPVISPRN
jgi:hypothetical protein